MNRDALETCDEVQQYWTAVDKRDGNTENTGVTTSEVIIVTSQPWQTRYNGHVLLAGLDGSTNSI
jgi:hypothetical protein